MISSKLFPLVSGSTAITNIAPAKPTPANKNQHPCMPTASEMSGKAFTIMKANIHRANIHIVDPIALA